MNTILTSSPSPAHTLPGPQQVRLTAQPNHFQDPQLYPVSSDGINSSPLAARQIYLLLVGWLSVVVIVGYFDWARAVPDLLRGPLVIAGIVLPTLLGASYPPFRSRVDAMPDAAIVAFHGWRILAGFSFLFAGARDLLPMTFVYNAGYGDIAVGALALVMLLLPENRRRYIWFHLFGLADFVLAVGTGLYFTLLQNPQQSNLFTFPLVLIPWYGVGLSGASHLLVLRRLLMSTKR